MTLELQTFEFNSIEKVFDTSLYKDVPLERRKRVIANHLAGLVLEAGDRDFLERINPWWVVITPDGQAIDIISRQDVSGNFGDKTPLLKKEKIGAIDFYYNKGQLAKPGDVIYWFSPEKGDSLYKEARINVAEVVELYGLKILKCYGIPLQTLPKDVLKLVEHTEELREKAFIFEPQNPFLKNSDWWLVIKNGVPKKMKSEAIKAALVVAKEMAEMVEEASGDSDFVSIGAYGEKYMLSQGWFVNKIACPGVFNLDILARRGLLSVAVDGFGNYRKTDVEVYFDCPNCEGKIPSGRGITTCPYCNAKKDDYKSDCSR
ncbi:MAG: hypothetical protein AAB546_00465 [Patescibacteria group bacterium]